MNKRILYSGCFFLILILSCAGQSGKKEIPQNQRGDIRIMFYNTENFFDTRDDSLTNDNEFLPVSDKHWTYQRYENKRLNTYKTIAAIGESEAPEIICMSEVENRQVLSDLIYKTPLEKYPYAVIHYDSPDIRGIDVGMLYRKDKLSVLSSQPIRIVFPDNITRKTRDILYARLCTSRSDTLHLFVNHWPSRRGGEEESEGYRQQVASVLSHKVDSILSCNPGAKIIITGDFNDEPSNKSLVATLGAATPAESINSKKLYNLSGLLAVNCQCGTYRYKSEWNMLDQFIVSGALLNEKSTIHTCNSCLHIADFPFLLSEEKKYGGTKPYRTYQGPKYLGGFSDHLPIYLDLFY
jgi:hypothetical protein